MMEFYRIFIFFSTKFSIWQWAYLCVNKQKNKREREKINPLIYIHSISKWVFNNITATTYWISISCPMWISKNSEIYGSEKLSDILSSKGVAQSLFWIQVPRAFLSPCYCVKKNPLTLNQWTMGRFWRGCEAAEIISKILFVCEFFWDRVHLS